MQPRGTHSSSDTGSSPPRSSHPPHSTRSSRSSRSTSHPKSSTSCSSNPSFDSTSIDEEIDYEELGRCLRHHFARNDREVHTAEFGLDEDEEDFGGGFEGSWEVERPFDDVSDPDIHQEEDLEDGGDGGDGGDGSDGFVDEDDHDMGIDQDIDRNSNDHGDNPIFSDEYPNQSAGAPTDPPFNSNETETPNENPWAPFKSSLEWEIARWAKLRGPGSTAFSDLLAIPGVKEWLNLSYSNTRELNKILDDQMTSRRPSFQRREVVVQNEACELYYRDILACIRSIWADEDLAEHLIIKPVRQYTDEDRQNRVYSDMHTATWWWETQLALDRNEEGGTVVPIVISSDKTTLTSFGGKEAYPIYMTIGNVPKHIRRKPSSHAQILLGYLPIASLKHVPAASRRRTLTNLFHYCVNLILAPLKDAGEKGVPMRSGDGIWRRCHPIFATFVGDYPEQLLVTCIKKGECPICVAKPNNIGAVLHYATIRDIEAISNAFNSVTSGATAFRRACGDVGVKPVQNPFWLHLPFVDIYHSITPDILHQLYQGLVKHLVEWLREAYGDAEIDARCRRLPPNHQLRHFGKGITSLTRVTGKEHSQISRILLGIILEAKPLGDHTPTEAKKLILAVRSLLDFVFIAQFPIHTTNTLRDLKTALRDFHEQKQVFLDMQIRKDFKIPKLHFLEHYFNLIQFYGTTDNYNTEYTERLHIDFAKEAYRSTNMKDEFPQMTLWLERREKVIEHEQLVRSRLMNHYSIPHLPTSVNLRQPWRLTMTKHPSSTHIPLDEIIRAYKASQFTQALAQFIVSRQDPAHTWRHIEQRAKDLVIPADVHFKVYNSVKFVVDHGLKSETVDIIHAKPPRLDKRGRIVPARFDTALLTERQGVSVHPVKEYRIVQVHAIFELPTTLRTEFLSTDPDFGVVTSDSASEASSTSTSDETKPPTHLAYVELFTKLGTPDGVHGLYPLQRMMKDQHPVGRIIPVTYLCRSVHLFPRFGPHANPQWSSSNVLEGATHFFVNKNSDRDMYLRMSEIP